MGIKVQEFMTTKIEFVEADRSVYDAVEKMVDRRIRSVVVRFPGKTAEYGVMTTRDIVFRVLAKGINPKDVKASEIASKPVVSVDRDLDVEEAAKLMANSNIARLFVRDGDRIVGLVSLLDIMSAELIIRARGDHGF
ncbi:MAG: CBS domain-containing protein [Deltaproteobacteria bacterium]|nr:CBS domain-containing protein [Deltaproteobacteria bacterium]